MANAGRVAIVPKGEYSATVAYKRLDLVRYQNDLYVAKKANTGVLPTDTTTWMLCMENVTQSQYDDLINGTTPVGNAKLLNGLTAEEFVSNENLLINPDFKNPVNSSGKTEWVATSNGSITIFDKWQAELYTSATVTLGSEGVVLTKGTSGSYCSLILRNYLQGLSGKIVSGENYTFSVKADGVVYSHTFKGKVDLSGGITLSNNLKFYYVLSSSDIFIRSYVDTITIEWIKLEKGSVATPFIPPNKEVEKLKCGVANADTVDGKHAIDFIGAESVFFESGETVLDWAITPNGIYKKYAVQSKGYPSDAPVQAEGWYELLVDKNASGRRIVRFTPYNPKKYDVWLRGVYNGSWNTEWTNKLDNYLPLDGSVPMSGDLIIEKGGTTSTKLINYNGVTFLRNRFSTTNYDDIQITSGRKLNFTQCVDGVVTENTVLHTGNSNAIIKSTTAPSDTTVIWIDITNKKTKAYIDGAWTVIA